MRNDRMSSGLRIAVDFLAPKSDAGEKNLNADFVWIFHRLIRSRSHSLTINRFNITWPRSTVDSMLFLLASSHSIKNICATLHKNEKWMRTNSCRILLAGEYDLGLAKRVAKRVVTRAPCFPGLLFSILYSVLFFFAILENTTFFSTYLATICSTRSASVEMNSMQIRKNRSKLPVRCKSLFFSVVSIQNCTTSFFFLQLWTRKQWINWRNENMTVKRFNEFTFIVFDLVVCFFSFYSTFFVGAMWQKWVCAYPRICPYYYYYGI